MLSQHTQRQIEALSDLCSNTFSAPLDVDALVAAVGEQAKHLLNQKVNSLDGQEPAALYGWIEHQALQTEINLWLEETGFDGLGTNGIPRDAQNAFLTGLISIGLPESALTCIGKGQQKGEDTSLELLRGKALSALGQPEAAISSYLSVAGIHPDDHRAYFHLAGEYLRLGRHVDALDAFDSVIERQPGLPGPWHNKGVCLYQLEDFEQASNCFEKASALAPGFAGSWIALGKCFLALGDTYRAIDALLDGLQLGEPHPELHKTLGLALKQEGKSAEAAEHLNLALEQMPEEVGLYLARAECLADNGGYAEALKDLARLKAIEPYNVQSAALEFTCLFALKRYAEAERCYYFLQGMHPKATQAFEAEIQVIRKRNQIAIATEEPTCA
ncbi:tetratricopeptide repeat protein [Parasalinivibrio latis]|uniref:tetratricopeptide repeat protein n=1 Tax=Parasalinivibrio latis TaxID=2952610 RepID=UPI0030DF6413